MAAIGAIPKTYSQTTANGVIQVPYETKTPTTKPLSASQAGVGVMGSLPITTGAIPPVAPTTPSYQMSPAPPKPMSASAAGVGTTQFGMPKVQNSATNTTGNTPALGYGSGGTYGQTTGLGQAYSANQALISTDAGKASEIKRTQDVIAARQAAGLDTSEQQKYLTVNLGYKQDQPTNQSFGVPQQDWKAMAEAEWLDQLNDKTRTSEEKKNSLLGAWSNSNRIMTDNRTLEDLQLNRTLNPFSGQTNYAVGLVGREREQMDAQALAQYNSAVGEIDNGLADYRGTAAQKIMARAYEMEQQANDRAMQEAGLTGTYKGTQTLAGKKQSFDQNLDMQKFTEDKARYGEQFAYTQYRDQIKDAAEKRDFDEKVKQSGIDSAIKWYSEKTSRMNANTSAGSLAWSKDPNNPDNIYKNAQTDQLGKPDLNKVFDQLSSLYVSKDPNTDAPTITNAAALRSAIVGMGMSDSDTDTMLLKFGLRPN